MLAEGGGTFCLDPDWKPSATPGPSPTEADVRAEQLCCASFFLPRLVCLGLFFSTWECGVWSYSFLSGAFARLNVDGFILKTNIFHLLIKRRRGYSTALGWDNMSR